ncbi:MAG: hypothetical protein HYZ79_02845 [Candidatus Melainabacteria bacterium]|nr:hypothetical protein [Candidatus Melainabacteria bacterium]
MSTVNPIAGNALAQAHPYGHPINSKVDPIREEQLKKIKLYGGGAIGALLVGGLFKDGLKAGFTRFADVTNGLSHLMAVPFSFLFPFLTLDNERGGLTGKQSKDDLLTRMTYTAASLAFTPNTWGEPLKSSTKSGAHMAATLLNLPHMAYVLLTYTGGRAMGFLTSLKKRFAKDRRNEYRYEQEFESLYKLGNLGSSQAAITPLANQFVLGWQSIFDVCKGDFGSAFERFKDEPISVFLGTFFNSWMWPFDYLAKIFDTTVRTAEYVDQIRNAFPKDNPAWKFVISSLETVRNKWHTASKDQNTATGKFLKFAREASKIEALICPPIGMASVVAPAFQKFLKGQFWNREAQEIGGAVGFLDKVGSTAAFLSHLYYTGVYTFNVRLPQFVSSSIFYGTNLYNKMRGINISDPRLADDNYRKQAGYVDPTEIRDRVFNNRLTNVLSDFAENRLDQTELMLHPDSPIFIKDRWVVDMDKPTRRFIDPAKVSKASIKHKDEEKIILLDQTSGKEITAIKYKKSNANRHIRNYAQTMAEEVCYTPVRESLYTRIMENELYDEYLAAGGTPKGVGDKPADNVWGKILESKKNQILEETEEEFRKYLRDSQLLEESKIEELVRAEYHGEGLDENESSIKDEAERLIDIEIKHCAEAHSTVEKKLPIDVKSHSLLELITKPKDLWEVLKLRFFHVTNTWLPLWVRGFIKVVDYGKPGEAYWRRNIRAQELGIREGDIKQACDREYLPVAAYAFQSLGKGLALGHGLLNLIFKGQPLPNFSND